MQNGILKRAILDFRRFYALKSHTKSSVRVYPQADSHGAHSALAKPYFRV